MASSSSTSDFDWELYMKTLQEDRKPIDETTNMSVYGNDTQAMRREYARLLKLGEEEADPKRKEEFKTTAESLLGETLRLEKIQKELDMASAFAPEFDWELYWKSNRSVFGNDTRAMRRKYERLLVLEKEEADPKRKTEYKVTAECLLGETLRLEKIQKELESTEGEERRKRKTAMCVRCHKVFNGLCGSCWREQCANEAACARGCHQCKW